MALIKKLGRSSNNRSYRRQLGYRLFDPHLPSTAIYLQPLVTCITIRFSTSFPPAKEKPQIFSVDFLPRHCITIALQYCSTRIVPFKYNSSRVPASTWSPHNCYATLILYPKLRDLSAYLTARAMMCPMSYLLRSSCRNTQDIVINQTNLFVLHGQHRCRLNSVCHMLQYTGRWTFFLPSSFLFPFDVLSHCIVPYLSCLDCCSCYVQRAMYRGV